MAYQEVKVRQPLLLTILPVLSLTTFFVGWQAMVSYGFIPNELLASPSQVFQAFLDKIYDPMPDGAILATHIWTSIKEAFLGYTAFPCLWVFLWGWPWAGFALSKVLCGPFSS